MDRRDFLQVCKSGAVAAPLAAGLVYPILATKTPTGEPKETAYERILRTNVLRCGYLEFEPNFIKDPITGAMTGIFADLMNEMGRLQNLKVEWVEEGGVTTLLESLRVGRIDAVCSGLWPNALRGQHAEFSQPVFYNVLGVFARANDRRFDHNLKAMNDPSVRIAVIDGEMADQISSVDFPRAQKISLPALSNFSQLLLTVTTGKADITIAATHEALAYEAQNPGELRLIELDRPIRTFPNVLFFKKGEFELVSMMDSAIDEVYYAGHLDQLITKYEKFPDSFVRVQKTH